MARFSEFPKRTLVTGGISSGKSLWVENIVTQSSLHKVYVATAQPLDDELKQKIKLHQARRSKDWHLLEKPFTKGNIFNQFGEGDIILLECISTWLGNLLYKNVDLEDHIGTFLANLANSKANIVIVSVETGWGVIPENQSSRTFVQELGKLNQSIARASDLVVLVAAGIPLAIKGELPE